MITGKIHMATIMTNINILNKMFFLSVFILTISSCSVIYRSISYCNNNNTSWHDTIIYVGKTELYHIIEQDTVLLCVNRENKESDFMFGGLPFIPIPIVPIFLEEDFCTKLDIDIHFLIQGSYRIYINNIQFVTNRKRKIYPVEIKELIGNQPNLHYVYLTKQQQLGLNDTLDVNEYKYFRFHFKEKLKNIKYLEININGIQQEGKNKTIPILSFKRKSKYHFYPVVIH
ncbi:MAG: hypothetical protein LBS69_05195 [Prevotellaceae bacterium]|jgi:hypothetical protein|nr:hypothetical protein [Prevotellaceae bacterium]